MNPDPRRLKPHLLALAFQGAAAISEPWHSVGV
jgi:hypothetical protein